MFQAVHRDYKGEYLPRAGVMYDVQMRGWDTSFWKALSGTPSVASNKLRLNADTIGSYYQFLFGIFDFAVNVPTTPSSGEAKKWGLLNPNNATGGSAYFEIVGSVFRAVSYDDDGNAQTTVITWGGWETSETLFRIEWERGYIIFSVAGTVVATHLTRVGKSPLGLYLINADSDNTDLGYINAKEFAHVI